MIGEKSLYEKIGKTLASISPEGVNKVIMYAFDLSKDGGGVHFNLT